MGTWRAMFERARLCRAEKDAKRARVRLSDRRRYLSKISELLTYGVFYTKKPFFGLCHTD
jgi:hypothetical protein